jgi:hypothetical protein
MNLLTENDFFRYWEEDDVICYLYKAKIIDLEIAKLGVDLRLKVSNHKKCVMYVDMSNVSAVTREARSYYTSPEATQLIAATAVFTPSFVTKTIATFFLNFNRPPLPFKIFSNKEKAIEWLKEIQGKEMALEHA